jgi:cbb3-type cytochrome oxidase cytochrome c subunit
MSEKARRVAAIGVAVVVAGIGLIAQGSAKLAEAGKQLYEKHKCADCHTINNRGGRLTKQFPMDDIGKKPATELRMWLTNPLEMEAKSEKSKTTKLKLSSKKYKFTDPELDALVAYLQTLVKK